MDTIDVDVERTTTISDSTRARQLESMFDVPYQPEQTQRWRGTFDLPDDWQVGLIVGPSGAGKTTILGETFGHPPTFAWDGQSVVDDFADDLTMGDITAVCQSVGFNTIPAWLRPFPVLSNGEQFRVTLARALIESTPDRPIVFDEFTSVVDRQVAKIGAHAVQKWVRRNGRQFVAASCHYDIVEWMQPDWVLEPHTMTLTRRSVQPRPRLDVTVAPVGYHYWSLFAPFHYLTAELNRAARCWVAFVDEQPAAFCGVLHRPHARTRNIKGVSRLVTLPDWQGLGLAFHLVDTVASIYLADRHYTHTYPAHPALIRSFDRSPKWTLRQAPSAAARRIGKSTAIPTWNQGRRPNAVFRYVGDPCDEDDARRLLRCHG